jgi:hypothetical protein
MAREQAAVKAAGGTSRQVVEFALERHLTLEALRSALSAAERSMAATPADVIVDCSRMESYDVEARAAFVEWNARMRSHIAHLAVLTNRPMWHLVVSGMALASRQRMKAFTHRADALAWFRER